VGKKYITGDIQSPSSYANVNLANGKLFGKRTQKKKRKEKRTRQGPVNT
jgi:hypothetical protein